MIGTPGDAVLLEKLMLMCGFIILLCILGILTIGFCKLIECFLDALIDYFKKKKQ